MITAKNPVAPREAVNYWSRVSQSLAVICNDLGRTLPEAPEGMRGMSEDVIAALQEAFDEALLAADTALGMCSRVANATADRQPAQPPQQQVRPQRAQQPYAHAGW
jgi:hypothetical protein